MGTNILLIGGSAGSISVLLQVLPDINPGFMFPIIIILHRKAYPKSALHQLFETTTLITVEEIYDKTELENGKIYLVPADYHLLFENKRLIALDASEKINYSRPSIDVTFESAASIFKDEVTAILLSGGSVDGVMGLQKIMEYNGQIAVQDPNTAEVSYMPLKAIEKIPMVKKLTPEQMAEFINQLKN